MNVTRDDIGIAIGDLSAAFGPPFGAQANNAGRMAEVWHRALQDLESHDLKRGVADLVRDRPAGSRWPAPADIRKLALSYANHRAIARAHAAEAAANDDNAPRIFCLHCHTTDLYVTGSGHGRFAPLHRDGCQLLMGYTADLQRLALLDNAPVWLDGAPPNVGLA